MSDHEIIQMIREALGTDGTDPSCNDMHMWADVLAYDQTELCIDTRHGGRVQVDIGTRPIRSWALNYIG